ncbi:MAG: hypothetical protein KatS3mg115_2198 [Candidatus Poribacteria bacterium]|nr:MAG: hypothetical protein KatS3mg115_2198 [Candidatus Poribacteria bacterium]
MLTRIDVKETLKKKLNADFRPYVILGACNPPIAYRALQAEPQLGLLLPCNVVVQETPEGKVEVSAIDPVTQMAVVDNPALAATGRGGTRSPSKGDRGALIPRPARFEGDR